MKAGRRTVLTFEDDSFEIAVPASVGLPRGACLPKLSDSLSSISSHRKRLADGVTKGVERHIISLRLSAALWRRATMRYPVIGWKTRRGIRRDLAESTKLLEDTLASPTRPPEAFCVALLLAGRSAKRLERLVQAIDRAGSEPKLTHTRLLVQAQRALSRREFGKARTAYAKVRRSIPMLGAYASYKLGWIDLHERKLVAAQNTLTAAYKAAVAAKQTKFAQNIHYDLIRELLATPGDVSERAARKAIAALHSKRPVRRIKALSLLGTVYHAQGDFQAAAAASLEALNLLVSVKAGARVNTEDLLSRIIRSYRTLFREDLALKTAWDYIWLSSLKKLPRPGRTSLLHLDRQLKEMSTILRPDAQVFESQRLARIRGGLWELRRLLPIRRSGQDRMLFYKRSIAVLDWMDAMRPENIARKKRAEELRHKKVMAKAKRLDISIRSGRSPLQHLPTRVEIRRHMPQLAHCMRLGLFKKPKLSGRVKLVFTINKRGRVVSSTTQGSTLASRGVLDCIKARVKTWIIRRVEPGNAFNVGNKHIVTYPLVLEPTPPR